MECRARTIHFYFTFQTSQASHYPKTKYSWSSICNSHPWLVKVSGQLMEEWTLDRGFSEIRIILTTMSVRSKWYYRSPIRTVVTFYIGLHFPFFIVFFYQPKLQFRSVYCFAIKCKKKNNNNNNKKKQENLNI